MIAFDNFWSIFVIFGHMLIFWANFSNFGSTSNNLFCQLWPPWVNFFSLLAHLNHLLFHFLSCFDHLWPTLVTLPFFNPTFCQLWVNFLVFFRPLLALNLIKTIYLAVNKTKSNFQASFRSNVKFLNIGIFRTKN